MTEAVTIRTGGRADGDAIASLHATSWQRHYRGTFSDAYLDGPVVAERRAFWQQRLEHPRDGLVVLLAEAGGALVGFVCALVDHDRDFGTLIDNLHVAGDQQGQGTGRQLMRAIGDALQHDIPRRPLYLFVLLANTAAQSFYDRIGGTVAERLTSTEPDGSQVPVLRYVWSSPAALIAGASDA